MITVDLPEDVKERISKSYQKKLEDENAKLLRRMITYRDEVAGMRAQVAVMQELFGQIRTQVNASSMGDDVMRDMDALHEIAVILEDQALSAAPKVVWHNKGTAAVIIDRDDGSLRLRVSAGLYSHWHLEVIGIENSELDGQQVDILAYEPEGTDALRGGCKAQETDDEQIYEQAKGAIPWHEGNELPENTIARLRGRAVAEPRQPSDSAEERQQDG